MAQRVEKTSGSVGRCPCQDSSADMARLEDSPVFIGDRFRVKEVGKGSRSIPVEKTSGSD